MKSKQGEGEEKITAGHRRYKLKVCEVDGLSEVTSNKTLLPFFSLALTNIRSFLVIGHAEKFVYVHK